MESIWIVLGVILLMGVFLWITYNSLVTLRERIREALSSIDVQLKRRTDLIPNLIETVKGYAKHEKTVFEEVTKARTSLMNARSPHEKAQAENFLEGTLKSLFAVAENYPQLKANENFLNLQVDLTDTENKIAYSRQFYNSNVLEYNTKIKSFPILLFSQGLGFKEEEFFEANDQDKSPVKVQF